MTQLPPRQRIADAEPLDFPKRRPVKNDLTITVKATIDEVQRLSIQHRRAGGFQTTAARATETAPLPL